MTFNEKLEKAIKTKNSHVCLGLDTDINKLPDHYKKSLKSVLSFNKEIINATKEHVSAYKLNIAFYECFGADGWDVLEETLSLIPKDIVTIADAKRADIGNTSNYYAKTFFEKYTFDSVTVAPYMGYDSLSPFFSYKDKGVIVLVLTSNKGSEDFQRLKTENGNFLFEEVADKLASWNDNNNLAVVVGATNQEYIRLIRNKLKNEFFLVPGVGAQGGSVKDVVEYAGNKILINSSRSLIYASSKKDFAEICKENTLSLKNEINSYLISSK